MKSNKKSPAKIAATRQEEISNAIEVLQKHGLEVFTLEEGESPEDLANILGKRAYALKVEAEAEDIMSRYKNGEFESSDDLREALNMVCNEHGMDDSESYFILQFTDNADAYEEIYGKGDESVSLAAKAVSAIQQDVEEELRRNDLDFDNPGDHRYKCKKCGDVHSEEADPEECPICGDDELEEQELFVVDGSVVCRSCLENDNDYKGMKPEDQTAMTSGEIGVCENCDCKLKVP